MKHALSWRTALLLILSLLASACGNDGGGGGGNPTATVPVVASPTSSSGTATAQATATATPQAATATPRATTTPAAGAGVTGLIVLRQDVAAGADDALGAPPAAWGSEADQQMFDRALSHAEWTLSGPVARSGATGPDGRFEIPPLPAGAYVLELSKTLGGQLLRVRIPFDVGTDGTAVLLIEIAPDGARTVVEYRDGNVIVRQTVGPDGSVVVTRDGRPVEVEDPTGSFADPDGDGMFEPDHCGNELWLCADDGQCGPDRKCTCTASCPECEDCGPPVCAPALATTPYRCGADGTCANPGDECVCVPSCPACDDCALAVCVPSCEPVAIEAVQVLGPSQITVGRRASLRAAARLQGGGRIDVTHQVEWQSTDEAILTVDSWGTAIGVATGSASAIATLGVADDAAGTEPDKLQSIPFPIRIVERATLERIYVQNVSCYPYLGRPDEPFPGGMIELFPGDILPPSCHQVVQIGGTIQFTATGEFADGTYEDITRQVEWRLGNPRIGEIETGFFTAREAGDSTLTAALDGVVSEATEIRVVSERTVVGLNIYPLYYPGVLIDPLLGGPFGDARPDFCFDCGGSAIVLRGDELPFRASAIYDTGEWEDVTERVTWRSSDPGVATIDDGGLMVAVGAGEAQIDATLDEVTSAPSIVRVVAEATLLELSVYSQGADRVVPLGGEALFAASAYYDVGFARDVTGSVTWWSSDESVGGFDEPGIFIGRSAGNVEIWAELDGAESNRLPMEVFATTDIDYCDAANINRGTWSDGFNRVVLESDCGQYTPPAVVTLRFTVTERDRPGGIFDPCLDLFVYQGSRPIRTIREEGCGEPFAPGAPEADGALPRYQLQAFWDLKDNAGNVVPPGVYTIHGRFFLYYDPVVSIDVAVVAPNGRIPCRQNDCGNGCGTVHACGDVDLPEVCPTVCTSVCECPLGWGITLNGDCEPCG